MTSKADFHPAGKRYLENNLIESTTRPARRKAARWRGA
jgi:hypothetical protein